MKLAPCDGPVTIAAERASPSVSVSLPSTPGAVACSGVSSSVEATSSIATGASFTALTVIVTVTGFESAEPSLAL